MAAELLASGYALELMDGDASHVPLCWVIAVLGKLQELLQDANLFVLSVLGIQSTGKSTLLNTVFGFQTCIKDLWKAILYENFIFSFKNTMEITAYNILDAKYAEWSWEFQRRMLHWQERAKHRIESTPVDKLYNLKRNLMSELSEEATEIYTELESELNTFFETSKQRDIMAQWKRRTQLRLQEVRNEHEGYAREQCRVLVCGRQALSTADDMKQHHQNEILLLVKKQVFNLEKGTLNDEKLNQFFEEKWLEWMIELKSSRRTDQSNPDIEGYLESCLRELLSSHQNLLNPKLTEASLRKRASKSLTFSVQCNHTTANKLFRGGKRFRGYSHDATVERETDMFLDQAKEYLECKKKFETEFQSSLLS